MVGKLAFLFPGQGSQSVGMGKSYTGISTRAAQIFEQADAILGFSLSKLMFEGPEDKLRQTEVTQSALFTASAAALELLWERGVKPSFVAGHSVGEYAALYVAQVIDFETGLKLVRERGLAMQKVSLEKPGAMAAILGLGYDKIQDICSNVSKAGSLCFPANFNTETQIVVSGSEAGVIQVMEQAQKEGAAKAVRLNVSGAFHSPLMAPAAQHMKTVIDAASFQDTFVPVITNVDAQDTLLGYEFKRKLVEQIDHPVRWHESLVRLVSLGVETFVEVGSGKVLGAMAKKLDRRKNVFFTDDFDAIEKALTISLNPKI